MSIHTKKYLSILVNFNFDDCYVGWKIDLSLVKDKVVEFLETMGTIFHLAQDVPNARDLVEALVEHFNWQTEQSITVI